MIFLPRLINYSWGCWDLWYQTAFPHLLAGCNPCSLPPPHLQCMATSAVYGHICSVRPHLDHLPHTRGQELLPPPRHTRRGFGVRGVINILFWHEREREGAREGQCREGLCRGIPRNRICTFYDRSDGNATELNYYSLILLSHFPPGSLLPSSLGNTETYKQIPPHEK